MGAGRADDERETRAERRDDEADRREVDADLRERQIDARERVLDRWEREIAARARSLGLLDDITEDDLDRARLRREHDHERRRGAAEERREAAIERDVVRALQSNVTGDAPPSRDRADVDATASFVAVAEAMRASVPLEELLELILAAGVGAIPEGAAASVTLVEPARPHTTTSTTTWASGLDAAQLELGCGPLPSAVDAGMAVTADLAGDARWPQLAGLADAARGVISVGLPVDDSATGVLTVYSEVGGRFDDHAVRLAELLAALLAAVLARSLERATYEAQADAWHRAVASRDVIGQAKGILMELHSATAEEAFQLLRETSQRLNRKLHVIADHVVAERRLPDE